MKLYPVIGRLYARKSLVIAVLALGLCIPCFAGSETGFSGSIAAGGINFTATLIVNNAGFDLNTLTCQVANCSYTLTFTGLNTNLTTSTLNAFALQLFGMGSNASFDLSGGTMIPAGWEAVAGAKINNGNPGLGCNPSGGASGWLCATALTMPSVLHIGSGQHFTMTFSGNFQQGTSILNAFDLMAHGLTNGNNNNSHWAISQGFDFTEFPVNPIPEPPPIAVIGSGLFSALVLLRRQLLL